MKPSSLLAALAALAFALFGAAPALASAFVVDPVRIDLAFGARSSALAIRNDDDHPLGFQLKLMQWTQDADGQDRYSDTGDLIFFPKILTVRPGQSKIVRVGLKVPVIEAEKSYRLFIEELPTNVVESTAKGVHIGVLFRIGAPVFVQPQTVRDGLEISDMALVHGQLTLAARNTGNRHQEAESIKVRATDAAGREVYASALSARYLLAGAVKPFSVDIPAERCSSMAAIEVTVRTNRASARRQMDVAAGMCAR